MGDMRFQILPTVGSRIALGWLTNRRRWASIRTQYEFVGYCLRFVSAIAIWKRRTYIRNSIVINWKCLIFRITQVNLEYIKCKVISANHK